MCCKVQLLVISPDVMRGLGLHCDCKQTGSGLKKDFLCRGGSRTGAPVWISWTGRSMLWRRPSVCQSLVAEPLAPGSYNLVQLISMMREICFLFFKIGGQRSMFVLSHSRKTWQDTDWNISSRIYWSTWWEEDAYFFKVGGQRSSSYCHIVGKRCKQDTEWTINSTWWGKCLLFFKVGGQSARSYCHIVGKSDRRNWRQDTDWTENSRILQQ